LGHVYAAFSQYDAKPDCRGIVNNIIGANCSDETKKEMLMGLLVGAGLVAAPAAASDLDGELLVRGALIASFLVTHRLFAHYAQLFQQSSRRLPPVSRSC